MRGRGASLDAACIGDVTQLGLHRANRPCLVIPGCYFRVFPLNRDPVYPLRAGRRKRAVQLLLLAAIRRGKSVSGHFESKIARSTASTALAVKRAPAIFCTRKRWVCSVLLSVAAWGARRTPVDECGWDDVTSRFSWMLCGTTRRYGPARILGPKFRT